MLRVDPRVDAAKLSGGILEMRGSDFVHPKSRLVTVKELKKRTKKKLNEEDLKIEGKERGENKVRS